MPFDVRFWLNGTIDIANQAKLIPLAPNGHHSMWGMPAFSHSEDEAEWLA